MDSQVISLGRSAEQFVTSPVWIAARRQAEAMIFAQWARTHETEIAKREALHAEMRALERFSTALQTLIANGEAEQNQLSRRAMR